MIFEIGSVYKLTKIDGIACVILDKSYSNVFHTDKSEITFLVLEKPQFIPLLPTDYYDKYGNDEPTVQWCKVLYEDKILYFSPHRYSHKQYSITKIC